MTEKDRHELEIAGLLHDCGKVTTPVHIVDKATKLQTIYDRIATIETRFEVIRRDAEIEALKARLARLEGGDGRAESKAELEIDQRMREIDADREFLQFCNVCSETIDPAVELRVKQIAARYRWRDSEGNVNNFLTDDEIENLTIRSGTLTPSERQIVNHHIEVTIQMLKSLPWPKHLQNVPEYAGGHHERMDGKGYPRGLKREDMSVQARCMGIADIFEALTAQDRPYKKANTLSDALAILGRFKLNGQIDPDLFDVFMWKKVYLRYAAEFLEPYQIDDVDLALIPGYIPPPSS